MGRLHVALQGQVVVKLGDLELSEQTKDGLGGPQRMVVSRSRPTCGNWVAPEVLGGHPFSQASDIYSLACVLWEILTGGVPFQSEIAEALLHGSAAVPDLVTQNSFYSQPVPGSESESCSSNASGSGTYALNDDFLRHFSE